MPQKRVLIAEDNDDWRAAIRTAVGQLGHDVTEAASAAEAERLLESQPFDLLITDNWMEVPDAGLGLLERTRSRDIPSILHTSLLSRVQKTRLTHHLPKVVPVLKSLHDDHTELMAAIEKLLS